MISYTHYVLKYNVTIKAMRKRKRKNKHLKKFSKRLRSGTVKSNTIKHIHLM